MKKVILSLTICLLISNAIFSQEKTESKIVLNWESNFKEALEKSKKEKKPILIYFTGSDWCSPCKILDEKLFHTKKFKEIADRDLILYEADYPRNKDLVTPEKLEVTNTLKREYNIKGFPTLVFVNHKGKKIAYKKGLLITEYYYPFIESVIKKY